MSIKYAIKRLGILFTLVLVMSGCSSPSKNEQRQQAIDVARAIYASNAIRLTLTAEPQMNAFNNMANSSTIIIAQASNREQLDKMMANPALLRNLFSGTGVAEGVLQLDSYVMMPGQSVSLHIDRAEQARYVSIIAGYYPAPDMAHTRIYPLPLSLTTEGWWHKRWLAKYIPIRVALTLGRQTIVRSQVSAGEEGDDVVYFGQQTATPAPIDQEGVASWGGLSQGVKAIASSDLKVSTQLQPAVAGPK